MKSKLFLTLLGSLCFSLSYAQNIVINKLYNSGTTSPAGQNDIVELLVVTDKPDLRNLIVKDFSGGAVNATAFTDAGGRIQFRNIAFWSSLRAGTTIVLRVAPTDANYAEDTDPSDQKLDLRISNTNYFDNLSSNVFNIQNYDMVVLKFGSDTGIDQVEHAFAFGITDNNTTFNAITGKKMRTNLISPTGGYLYQKSLTESVSDFDSVNEILGSGPGVTTNTWGDGTGTNNVNFVNYLRSSDYLYVHKSGNEVINGNKSFNGSISIGTDDAKGYKLAVAGSMVAEEVKIKLKADWPDFVFLKGYNLLSLEEVEAYINKNGHLPGVPSAKIVEKEGIAVGDINTKLLQKIEELTLYLIALKKESEDQKKEIAKLRETLTNKP
ncbi:hypothetical protein [Pedobacter chitinilyticus]|uniref:Peptidase S74 domain-containing protein n=1 Tax=Pedobacter chitinilyticus TaxID=2233776 RepID=A0A3S3Q1H2_9SPHI|nr:hypothetical protein [Pedobacter chitinilyticus]RWU10827.1 hypothetical protein DPV69_05715 [Pedobacter chitinilyticus]